MYTGFLWHWTIPKRSFLHLASLLGHLLLVFSRFQNDRIGPTLPCKFTINGEPTRKRGFEKQWLVNLSGILAEPASNATVVSQAVSETAIAYPLQSQATVAVVQL